jgi:hypothetical protein
LEAQRTAVARFAESEGITVAGEFTEVETGKGADALDRRPQLVAALATARKEPIGQQDGRVIGDAAEHRSIDVLEVPACFVERRMPPLMPMKRSGYLALTIDTAVVERWRLLPG